MSSVRIDTYRRDKDPGGVFEGGWREFNSEGEGGDEQEKAWHLDLLLLNPTSAPVGRLTFENRCIFTLPHVSINIIKHCIN